MNKNMGAFFIVFAAFLWSLDGILRRSLALPSLCIVFYEHLLGLILLSPVLLRKWRECANLGRREVVSLAWVALMGGFIGTLCYTSALAQVNYIPFSVVVLLQQLQPVFAIALAWLVLKESLSAGFVVWSLLALVGAYLVSFRGLAISWQRDHATVKAALLALAAAFAWGSSTVFGKHMLKKVSYTLATSLRFLLTTLFILPLLLAGQSLIPLTQLSGQQIGLLVAITCSAGMVSILFYYYGLNLVEAKVSTICEMFFPFSAMLIDILYFQAVFSWTQIFGSVLLLVSIYHVAVQKKERQQ